MIYIVEILPPVPGKSVMVVEPRKEVIGVEVCNHITVEPACKVSVLSNENWPYKRADLTSVDHISGLDCKKLPKIP